MVVERVRIDGVGGEVIIHLLPHVIDGDGGVAERAGDGMPMRLEWQTVAGQTFQQRFRPLRGANTSSSPKTPRRLIGAFAPA
jgi:hypothetical protein